jgi:hypothetical protein
MAKFCEVCKQPYPDDQKYCPHCTRAVEDSGIDLGGSQGEVPSSISGVSAVDFVEDLDEPAAAPASGAPTTQGSAIDLGQSEEGARMEHPGPAPVDSPADPDLHGSGPEVVEEAAEGGEPTSPKKTSLAPVAKSTMLAPESPPKPTMLAPESAPKSTMLASDQEMVRDLLGGEPPGLLPEPGSSPAEPPAAEGGVHLGQPVEEVPDLVEAEVKEVGDSGINLAELGEEAVVAEPSSDSARVEPVSESGIDLGDAVVVEDVTGAPLPGEAVAGDSGINLADIAPAATTPETPLPAGQASAADSGIVLDKDLVLNEPVTPPPEDAISAESPSSRDLIAEAVESGADLPGPNEGLAEPEAAETPEGSEVVSLDAGVAAPDSPSSSAVDLGSSAEVDLPPISSILGEAEAHAEEAAPGSAEAVDLAGLPEPPPSASGLSLPEVSASSVDLGSRREVEMEEAADEPGSKEVAESGIDLGELPEPEETAVGEEGVAVGDEAVAEEEDLVGAGVGAEEEAETRPLPARGEQEARPRGRKGAWLGGTLLGLVLGAGTLMGLWLFGIEPPRGWRMVSEAPKDAKGGGLKAPVAVESLADLLRRGEFDKAVRASAGQSQAATPEQLAERGEARWLSFLVKQRQAKAPVKADAEEVKQAIADLEKAKAANNANAFFWLGHIEEQTGQTAKALETYRQGAELFKANAPQKRLFEAAMDRVQSMTPEAPAAGAWLPPEWRNDPLALAALLLFALQAPVGEQPPQGDSEAGFEFWQAVKLAREQKYAEAIGVLDKARAEHDQRRFAHLRKAQNPLSDPTEEIFLKSCDELKAYWQAEEKLKKGGYLNLADKKDPGKAVDDLVKKAVAGDACATTLAGLTDKLTKDKIIDKPEDLDKGVTQLLADRKEDRAKIADLDKKLKVSTEEATDLAAKLKTSKEEAADLDKKLKDSAARETKLKADLAEEQAALQGIANDLKAAKFLDPKAGKEALVPALKDAVRVARMVDPMGYIQKLEGKVARDEAELKQRWRPEEMLAFWLPLLEQDRNRKDLSAKAVLDAERVQKDPEATPASRAHAEVIRGLALRNEEKFPAAREALQKAQEDLKGDRDVWVTRTEEALKEVSDPAGWYASRAEVLHNQGKSDEALALLGRAVEVLPAREQAVLLAQRSLIELDVARAAARGAIPPRDPTLAAARKDAEEAAKAGLAEGFYAAGRVAEETGRWAAAAENYRKAMAAHPDLDAAGSRYRIALARVLIQPGEGRPAGAPPAPPPPPAPKVEGDKVGRLELPQDAARRAEALRFAVLLAVLALQPPDMQPLTPGQEEAEKLADEILKAPPDKVPFDVRAQALAIKGRWTQGLLTYVEGLRPYLPPRYSGGLLDLVRNHPRLKRPDTLRVPNPLDAEKNYAAGLNFYFDRNYPAAEKAFEAAVENDSQDARYFYFLGLSRLAQNKREAYEDLDQGASLEAQNRPPSAVVSVALERIQGPLRRIVNEARTRPR